MDFANIKALISYLLNWVIIIVHNIKYALGQYEEHSVALEEASKADAARLEG